MKRVKSLIKLTNLKSENLNEKALNLVIAGAAGFCYCGCYYSECGGSSQVDNDVYNRRGDKMSFLPIGKAEWNYAHLQ
jgi:hypothetical protein